MSEITRIQDLHDAVMPLVVAELPECTSAVTTRSLPEHAEPPRVLWVPSRDRWEAPQKNRRAGFASGRSLATRRAGVELHCWGATIAATEDLVAAVARALRVKCGGASEFLSIDGGQWLAAQGATTLGEAYVLSLSVAIDVPALPDPPRTATPTSTSFQTAGTAGDGVLEPRDP